MGTKEDAVPVPAELLKSLRELRLWHWREVLSLRSKANLQRKYRSNVGDMMAAAFDRQANKHLGHVQTLNEFFAIGDTAERDDRRDFESAEKHISREV